VDPGGESQDIETVVMRVAEAADSSSAACTSASGGAIILLILSLYSKPTFSPCSAGAVPATQVRRLSVSEIQLVMPRSARASNSSRSSSTTRKRLGRSFCPSKQENRIGTPSSYFSATTHNPVVEERNRLPGLFTARRMKRFISTWAFSTS